MCIRLKETDKYIHIALRDQGWMVQAEVPARHGFQQLWLDDPENEVRLTTEYLKYGCFQK